MESIEPRSITQLGWRQGSVVPYQLLEDVQDRLGLIRLLEPEALAIIISQDCDVVCPSYETEPYVELLIARPVVVAHRDGNLFHGKNPRRFQFMVSNQEDEPVYEISIHEKIKVDRKLLEGAHPETGIAIDQDQLTALTKWTAKRYTRSAFPDEFNRRCQSAAGRITKKLKAKGNLITGIFLRLSSYEELSGGETYNVILFVTALPESCEDEKIEREIIIMLGEIEYALNQSRGIVVVEAALRSEAELTLCELRQIKRWDYDYLSYKDGMPDQIVPDT